MAEEDTKDEEKDEETAMMDMLDLTSKKKKKKKKTKKEEPTSNGATPSTTAPTEESMSEQQDMLQKQDEEQELGDPNDRRADYSYGELLERVVEIIQVNNPDLVEKKRTRIKPPHLQTISSRKTMWVNYQEICSMMQRDPQHVYQFFMAELGTEGSIDGNQRLIIRGRYLSKYIESLLRKYVVEYVTCVMCRSANTDLVKDPGSRLYFCNCRDCGSQRSVAVIKSGYHATSRADRRAARNNK